MSLLRPERRHSAVISATLGAFGIAITTLAAPGKRTGPAAGVGAVGAGIQWRGRRLMSGARSPARVRARHGAGGETCFRTRRHWRQATVGLLLLLVSTALARRRGAAQTRTPGALRPTSLIIDAIPRMSNWNDGSARGSFARRKFVDANNLVGLVVNGAYETIDPLKFHVRKLGSFEQRLLARRAAEALEANPNHHAARYLLIVLALSGLERERAFKIVTKMVSAPLFRVR